MPFYSFDQRKSARPLAPRFISLMSVAPRHAAGPGPNPAGPAWAGGGVCGGGGGLLLPGERNGRKKGAGGGGRGRSRGRRGRGGDPGRRGRDRDRRRSRGRGGAGAPGGGGAGGGKKEGAGAGEAAAGSPSTAGEESPWAAPSVAVLPATGAGAEEEEGADMFKILK